jgi:hypothetical protein
MEAKDRVGNILLIGAALAAWLLVAQIVTTTYPNQTATAGLVGAGAVGLACGLTSAPLFWLVPFSLHRRIALIGDWGRALRRAAWVGGLVALFVALRIQDVLSLPIAVFVVVLALLAEIALSIGR